MRRGLLNDVGLKSGPRNGRYVPRMIAEPGARKTKSLPLLVEDFLAEQRAQATRRAYAHAIGDFLKYAGVDSFPDLEALDRSFAVDYRNTLAERRRRAKTYVNRQLAALRGFFKGLVAQELLEKSPFDLVRGLQGLPRVPDRRPRGGGSRAPGDGGLRG